MTTINPSSSPSSPSSSLLMRKTQWIYLVPVITAPIAHIFVSASQKFRAYRNPILGLVALSTGLAVYQRLYFMKHSGYPGAEGNKTNDRYITNPHSKITSSR